MAGQTAEPIFPSLAALIHQEMLRVYSKVRKIKFFFTLVLKVTFTTSVGMKIVQKICFKAIQFSTVMLKIDVWSSYHQTDFKTVFGFVALDSLDKFSQGLNTLKNHGVRQKRLL